MKLSIVDWFGYNLPPQERVKLIKEAGFSAVMLLWADYFDEDYRLFPEYARQAGLEVENAHAPYMNANFLWRDNAVGQGCLEELLACVEDCAWHEIPTLVMHPENKNGSEAVALPESYDVGLDRIKRIVELAERMNVNVAIENMSRPEFLACIFGGIESERLGFCFDSGHCHVFTPQIDLLTAYGDKLMALHLHDNDGKEDWHTLPFSGDIDWKDFAENLTKLHYQGNIALEVGCEKSQHIKDPREFLSFAIASAERIFV